MSALLSLDALLAAHGLETAAESPFEHTGFSGALLKRLVRDDGAAFVLKRMTIDRDWIMRATDDQHCRETMVAASGIKLPDKIDTPALGVARDGDMFALLMRDIAVDLLAQGPITVAQLEVIVGRMAELHRAPIPSENAPWCGLDRRLGLLTPDSARIAEAYGAPVAKDIIEGWRLFEGHAEPRARDVVRALFADASPLLRALSASPSALLHGDLKFDNIGLDSDGRMWLIDWAMTLVAPPAVELGWFLAINSRRLPVPLDDVLAMYADAASIRGDELARHNALTAICGLLLRGWRKALDAEDGEPGELRWWCERVEAAERYLR